MKYIFALVCLIALASSQLKNKDGTCDTTNWSDYTDADCTDATKDAQGQGMTVYVGTMTVCKDVAGVALMADISGKICDDTCGSKGTCASTWKAVKDAADKKMGELTNCTKEAICASMSDSSGSGSGDDDDHKHEECCLEMYEDMQFNGGVISLCSAEVKKMIDQLPADAKTAADAEQKKEYGHLSDEWAENKCDTYSGKSFDSVASSAGYKDSISALPASSWFTGVFGLLLALWVSYMK